ncbi:hypothetical protein VZT92_011263 [Zoarces viviparus]|uniref:Ig-like domain-containing protein n=1 Tax=Zoarces viviparus TaxID=48416 RepID=A0AAW1FBC5_ZOAVI
MSEFRWIKTFLSLILVLQFTAAATGQLSLFVTVRDGDEVTLPCNSVKDDHENCDSTEWIFIDSRPTEVDLVKDGQIHEAAKDKSDRLSVSENCSLVIKNVKDEDGGRYHCRQLISGQEQGPDAQVYLSVVTLTEHKDDDEVTLRCSVKTSGGCVHRVKWLLQGRDVDKDHREFRTSQSECYASLTFLTSHFIYTSRFNSFQCEVTKDNKVQQFSFRNSPSGDDTITATTESTPTEDDTEAADTTTPPAISSIWWYVIVAAVLALLIISVALIQWKRTKGNTTRTDGNVGMTSHPAPETSQDTADPEEGVSYASVSFIKKTNSKGQGRSKHDDDDDDDAVTYATVKSSSADPSMLYAAITKQTKPKSAFLC